MFPWASLISLAGQGIGGIMSAVSARKEKQAADAEAARQQAHYEAKANEDALSRSENRQLLSEYDRKAQKQVETAKNVAAITGATPEYGLAVQKAMAEGRADLMGDIAAGDSARKDKYEQLAEGVRHDKAVADIQREAAKQESYANIIANSASAFGSMLGGYKAGDPSKAPEKSTPTEKVAVDLGNGQTPTKSTPTEKVAVDLGNGQTVQANPLEAGVINTVVNAKKNATAAPPATQQQPPVTSSTVDTILANKVDLGNGQTPTKSTPTEKVAVDLGNGQTVQANPLEAGVINTVVNAKKNATAAPPATQQQPPVTSSTVDTILANKKDEYQTWLNY